MSGQLYGPIMTIRRLPSLRRCAKLAMFVTAACALATACNSKEEQAEKLLQQVEIECKLGADSFDVIGVGGVPPEDRKSADSPSKSIVVYSRRFKADDQACIDRILGRRGFILERFVTQSDGDGG